MKKSLIILLIFSAVFAITGVTRANWFTDLFNPQPQVGASVFNSAQVGSSPQNGYYLKTNGTVSTWASVSATGGSVAQLGQIGDVATNTPEVFGDMLRWDSITSKWKSVATSTLGLGGGATLTGSTGQVAYFSGTNTAVGTSSLFINSAGNVGIGTTNPTELLTISGVSSYGNGLRLVGSSSGGVGFYLQNTEAGGHKYAFFSSGTSNTMGVGGFGIYDETGGVYPMAFLANGEMHIGRGYANPTIFGSSAGNVGIGTTGPNFKLEVNGTASSTTGYFNTLYIPSLGTAAGAFLAVNGSGQVIATTTPTGSMTYPGAGIPLSTGSAWGTSSTTIAVNYGGTGSSTLSGLLKGNGTGAVMTAVAGTDYVLTSVATLSSLTSIGTIATGVWQGTAITTAYGGTGILSSGGLKAGSIPFGNNGSAFATSTAFQFTTATSLLTVTNASTTNITNSGYANLATLLGTINAGGALSFEIPNGATPVFTDIGQIGFDTTDNQLLIATTTANTPRVIPTVVKLWGATIASTSPDFVSGGRIWLPPQRDGFIIDEIWCAVDGGTSVVLAVSNSGGTTDSETITCDADGQQDLDITTNPTYAAGSLNSIEVGTVTGTVDYLTFAIYGLWVRE
jgi:hypothetical protein